MDTQMTSGIIGIICLGFAAIGTFLLVPDRELTGRERLGIHTIFWAFVIYAMWIIYQLVWSDQNWTRWDKYFYIGVPFLLGMFLSLLAEFTSKRPPINIEDQRIHDITARTWKRLPNGVKRALQKTVMNIQEIPEWSELDKESLNPGEINAAKWFPILPFPARGIIHLSVNDSRQLPDDVIAGALAGEFGRAYQSTRTPFDTDTISKASKNLPLKWGFKKELESLGNRK
jgi:hypothetical protein